MVFDSATRAMCYVSSLAKVLSLSYTRYLYLEQFKQAPQGVTEVIVVSAC